MKLVFNKRSGAVVMTPDSEGLGAAVVAGMGSKPHSAQWYFIFLSLSLSLSIYIYIFVNCKKEKT